MKFLSGHKITVVLEKIIEEANDSILLISPYVRLHDSTIFALKQLLHRPSVRVDVCFGKSNNEYFKSLHPSAFEFLKTLPNVRIYHENRLHAKFYANELRSLFSSMNLYDFSVNNNIEFGIETAGASHFEGLEYFERVLKQAELLYERKPDFEKSFLGKPTYRGSTTHIDQLTPLIKLQDRAFSSERKRVERVDKTMLHPIEPALRAKRPQVVQEPAIQKLKLTGYCIRTGEPIPFDIDMPMSNSAYKSWSRYSNPDYPETFCHYSGEPSNGETSYNKPVLKKYWKTSAVHRNSKG